MKQHAMVRGDFLGLPIPATPEKLIKLGPGYLTTAFRATGAIRGDNEVVAIENVSELFSGGMGRKLLLTVSYRDAESGVPSELFVKFPLDFNDPLRALFGPFMRAEVQFALLSGNEDFPIHVPRCLFAEYHEASLDGILITERIRFGHGKIEPVYEKGMDYNLPEPLAHYRALAKAMVQVASHQKAGRFGPNIDEQFSFDRQMTLLGRKIPFARAELERKLASLQHFAKSTPCLFPHDLANRNFLKDFATDAVFVLEHENVINDYLKNQTDLVALCHPNANVDNAWFWRNEAGELEAGLLDWGGVGQMSLGSAYYGFIGLSETDFLNQHRRDLMSLIVSEYNKNSGLSVAFEDFALVARLSSMLMGLSSVLDTVEQIYKTFPDYRSINSRFDSRLQSDFMIRVKLQSLMVLLNEWREENYGAVVRSI